MSIYNRKIAGEFLILNLRFTIYDLRFKIRNGFTIINLGFRI